MNIENISSVLQAQREFFFTHKTKDLEFRLEQLKTLRKAILKYEDRLYEAFWKDLRKSKFEVYETEIGLVLEETGRHIRNLHHWAKPRKVGTNQLLHFWSKSRIYQEPYGLVLIMAPWNYPFQLLINPLIGALSAGNCVALKPSELTPTIAGVMEEMIVEFFNPRYISFFNGEVELSKALLEEKWDQIFFTGSPAVGRIVMESAARNLSPVVLELGGKSPCIVDSDANLKVAANRIAWGKFLNAGQTCIAPDYLFVHTSVKNEFLRLMSNKITQYFGTNPRESKDLTRIVSEIKTQRLAGFLGQGRIIAGGEVDILDRFVSPTILDNVKPGDPIMQEEIFGPILPVMEFSNISEVFTFINSHSKPLALYYFSEDSSRQAEVLGKTSSGGACINDVITHVANPNMPFGGVGNSGMGKYHGRYSFETFSHQRSVISKSTRMDVPVRYPPYRGKLRILKMLLK
ncbi:MAG: aldehyde dehydrogenase [Bacteroidetes bacterium]|nr:aldehyde dehydrogenase [Bacteroidota bacterium]